MTDAPRPFTRADKELILDTAYRAMAAATYGSDGSIPTEAEKIVDNDLSDFLELFVVNDDDEEPQDSD